MPARMIAGIMAFSTFAVGASSLAGGAALHPALRVGGEDPSRVLVVATGVEPDQPVADSPMARSVAGIASVIDSDRIKSLGACIGSVTDSRGGVSGAALCDLILISDSATRRARVRVTRDRSIVLSPMEEDSGPAARLRPDCFRALIGEASWHRGGFDEANMLPSQQAIPLDPPYRAAWIEMDLKTLRERFYRGASPPRAMARDLARERFTVRLPKGYSPRRPAGLLVWVSPSDDATLPAALGPSLDGTGAICIFASNSGNGREVADRLQLALDAAATASERFHVDPRRVYVGGFSGGAKIATILQACCPEFFMGCIAVGGTGWCEDVPIGRNEVLPRLFGRPVAEAMRTLRDRRIAAITGPEDFNYPSVRLFVRKMEHDGVGVRLFDVPGLGHAMPTSVVMGEALDWVDEPQRRLIEESEARGRTMMETHVRKFGDGPPSTDESRESLRLLTVESPWTDQAWEALRLLGLR